MRIKDVAVRARPAWRVLGRSEDLLLHTGRCSDEARVRRVRVFRSADAISRRGALRLCLATLIQIRDQHKQ